MIIRKLITYSYISQRLKKQQPTLQTPDQYLVFPTKFPIFPYYTYVTKLNKYLYQYIKKSNIKYVSTFSLKHGVSKQQLYPSSFENMISECNIFQIINNIIVNLKPIINNQIQLHKQKQQQNKQFLIYDQNINDNKNYPIYYINSIQNIYSIGSICKINLINQQQNLVYMRSQIKLEINLKQYQNYQNIIMYLNGKKIRNNLLYSSSFIQKYNNLLKLYQELNKINKIEFNNLKNYTQNKTIQILCGYLCTLSYFNCSKLYQLFSIANLEQKLIKLILYFQQCLNLALNKQNHMKLLHQITLKHQDKIIDDIQNNLLQKLGKNQEINYNKDIKNKLQTGKYPQHVKKIIQCQLGDIFELNQHNPQYNLKKHFINLLINYPFGVKSQNQYDIHQAKNIIEQDHYGMNEVKQRILEFIAVSKLKGNFKSKVLLLYGPPGVGKTSIVKSIAKCLNRPYQRISVGGQYDVSVIQGHRRTYIGAYQGKIFDSILKSKVENPVILIDEIDKIGKRQYGPTLQDAIMQILDSVQNTKFKDNYINVQIDLSNVLFICTANNLENIFPPLLDRLEKIQVSGYTSQEKQQIFRKHIIQQKIDENGLKDIFKQKINFTSQGIQSLIQGYCKQAGIRDMLRKTNQILQKIALQHVLNKEIETTIGIQQVKQYLGQPNYHNNRLFNDIPPKGVMIGLAYNSYGGSIMYIQASTSNLIKTNENQNNSNSNTSLIITGNLHQVMKQSCQLAYTYAKFLLSNFYNNYFLEINDIHLNFPEIEIGKDGPSAGIAITCTLISLALQKQPIYQIAMTGQINLSGNISAIGGIKEKILGAKRQKINRLLFPQQNRKDIQSIQQQIKQGITFQYASHFFDVMRIVFNENIKQITQKVLLQ